MAIEYTPAALDSANLERLKRICDLELAKPGALTPGGFHARRRYTAALIEQGDALIAAARRLESLVAFCQARIEQCIDAEAQGIPHPGTYREGRMAAFLAVQERLRGTDGK